MQSGSLTGRLRAPLLGRRCCFRMHSSASRPTEPNRTEMDIARECRSRPSGRPASQPASQPARRAHTERMNKFSSAAAKVCGQIELLAGGPTGPLGPAGCAPAWPAGAPEEPGERKWPTICLLSAGSFCPADNSPGRPFNSPAKAPPTTTAAPTPTTHTGHSGAAVCTRPRSARASAKPTDRR